MQVKLLTIGKTNTRYLQDGITLYEQRLRHYLPYQMQIVSDLKSSKNLSTEQQNEREGQKLLAQVSDHDYLMLLDERGCMWRSRQFADFLQQQMLTGRKTLVFAIGGAYGFSPAVYARANAQLALSAMTFSHQMIRLLFVEQLYRALTILRGEPYHHE
ncbi:MAG: 23S rRNA (pseudouridine(1915)-N(3))-methyltransferase RlmH [Spirulinaceae cyanobacterium SM2_1_0]|nr:23S rRNA (pseudouridine(1915)-N(3))-methyltransferase RlmH [Spirulinaceae cyanobacterium SM2_1_0]